MPRHKIEVGGLSLRIEDRRRVAAMPVTRLFHVNRCGAIAKTASAWPRRSSRIVCVGRGRGSAWAKSARYFQTFLNCCVIDVWDGDVVIGEWDVITRKSSVI